MMWTRAGARPIIIPAVTCYFVVIINADRGDRRAARAPQTDERRVGKIAWHCDQDYAESRNFAHAIAPRIQGAWATRRYAVPRNSTSRRWRVAHPTRSPSAGRAIARDQLARH